VAPTNLIANLTIVKGFVSVLVTQKGPVSCEVTLTPNMARFPYIRHLLSLIGAKLTVGLVEQSINIDIHYGAYFKILHDVNL
jgi:hypothetical protein